MAAAITSGNFKLGIQDAGYLLIDGPGAPAEQYTGLRCTAIVELADVAETNRIDGLIYGGFQSDLFGMGVGTINGVASPTAWGGGGGFIEQNLTVDSYTNNGTTATSVVHLTSGEGLKATHVFSAVLTVSNHVVFKAVVTIENTSGNTFGDVRYRRGVDFDPSPTQPDDYLTVVGIPHSQVLRVSTDAGFFSRNPFSTSGDTIVADVTDLGTLDAFPDHCGTFDIGIGTLAAGASVTFTIFWGAAVTKAQCLTDAVTVGAEIYCVQRCATHEPAFAFYYPAGSTTSGMPVSFWWGYDGFTPPAPVADPGCNCSTFPTGSDSGGGSGCSGSM